MFVDQYSSIIKTWNVQQNLTAQPYSPTILYIAPLINIKKIAEYQQIIYAFEIYDYVYFA